MQIQVLDKRNILGEEVVTYGDAENPLFLARDIAIWIDERDGYTVSRKVDEDEKLIHRFCVPGDTQERDHTLLTEEGLYEVLMLSKKPVAKEFKKRVKKLLKEIRLNKYKSELSPLDQLRLQYKVIENHEERFEIQEQKIEKIEGQLDDLPLQTPECDEISKAVKKVGVKILGGIGSKAYKNSSLRAKVYSDIHRQLKREFNVNSYKAIKRKYLDNALIIIENYNPPFILNDEISLKNTQFVFGGI